MSGNRVPGENSCSNGETIKRQSGILVELTFDNETTLNKMTLFETPRIHYLIHITQEPSRNMGHVSSNMTYLWGPRCLALLKWPTPLHPGVEHPLCSVVSINSRGPKKEGKLKKKRGTEH